MASPILKARNLSKHYGSGHTEVKAVSNASLDVMPGEMVLIMGPSGSGKTTLLSMVGGLLSPTEGTIEIDGDEITALKESRLPEIRALKIGFIFQTFNLLDALNVDENILFPARLRRSGISGARPRADELIERLGLGHRRGAIPRKLSGGEKQRVAIARALINEPKLILADEPTGNLDSQTGQEVIMILHDIARDDGCSVILVTHDPRVEEIADRIMWLDDGQLRDRKVEEHSWVRDPVCGMRVDEWTATIFSEHKNKRYLFCTMRCKERFEADPDSYLE
ncbi:MAG: ATP-binding cassette domain-containing protein [bacterium]